MPPGGPGPTDCAPVRPRAVRALDAGDPPVQAIDRLAPHRRPRSPSMATRIFEATGTDITDLGEEHGHRVLRFVGKGTRVVLVPLPPAVGRAVDKAIDNRTSRPHPAEHPRRPNRPARRHPPAAPPRRHRRCATAPDAPAHAAAHLRHHHARRRRRLRDVQIAARHADPRTAMRYDRARKNLDRHPNYILAAYMASGT